ncbi:hypothetical protein V6U81_09110 [Micromonospora sp. CPCC 205711]|uniref:hypothetical protein n=1 Tax=Micromonospora sp. CPCC 205547 TaxID=3122400 RepID=UPI002FF278B1
MRFFTDRHGFPGYESDEPRHTALGVWFQMELRNSPYQCLDLLAILDDVAAGRADEREWDGEAFLVTVTRPGVTVRNTILPDQHGRYELTEVRRLAEEYWEYLSDQPRPRLAFDLADWERTWSRTHPCRGRLFPAV